MTIWSCIFTTLPLPLFWKWRNGFEIREIQLNARSEMFKYVKFIDINLILRFFNIIHQNQFPLIKNYLKDHTWSILWLLVVSYVHFWPVWSHQAAPLVINATGLQWTVKQGKSWFFGLGITCWVGRFKLNDYFAHRENFRHCAWSVLASNLKTFIWLINPLQLH